MIVDVLFAERRRRPSEDHQISFPYHDKKLCSVSSHKTRFAGLIVRCDDAVNGSIGEGLFEKLAINRRSYQNDIAQRWRIVLVHLQHHVFRRIDRCSR